MDFKKKLKAFFTLSRHANGGFTLVELVIVIAILAILSGVGTAGYAGYIKKTNDAADKQLLAAVNTAFASACMEGKVDVANVTEASISMDGQKVFGLSTITATATETSAEADINVIAPAFDRYYGGNEEAVFKKENVNSLVWNDAEDSFVLSEDYTSMRVVLANGKTVNVSAEDLQAIQESTFADMGYSGIAEAINSLSGSSELLAKLAGTFRKTDRLTAVMLANGLISNEKSSELANNLKPDNILSSTYGKAAKEVGNGLQMVTAKYLASGANTDELLGMTFSDSTSMLNGLTGSGGTKTVSALALQYALVESFANSSASSETTVSYTVNEGSFFRPNNVTYTVSVSEFLASDYAKDDPIKAMAAVQATDGYKNNYQNSDQYNSDVKGFVGALSLLGDNLGSVNPDGSVKNDYAIDPNDYLSNGISSNSAKEVLTAVVGE